jgi:hypothetical protein
MCHITLFVLNYLVPYIKTSVNQFSGMQALSLVPQITKIHR